MGNSNHKEKINQFEKIKSLSLIKEYIEELNKDNIRIPYFLNNFK